MSDRWRALARSGLLLTGVLLAAIVIAALVVKLPAIQRWTAAQVAARMPAGVTIERVALTLLPPGVVLTNVSLAPGGPTFADVTCRLRTSALLAGRAEVGRVAVDGATIAIERGADGQLHIAGPLGDWLAPGGTNSGTAPAAPFALSSLPSLSLDNVTLSFVDRTGGGTPHTLSLNAARLTVGSSAGGTAPFTFRTRMDPAGLIEAHGSIGETAATGSQPADQTLELSLNATGIDAQTVLAYLAAIVPGEDRARAQGTLDSTLTLAGGLVSGMNGDVRVTQSSGSMVWDDVTFSSPTELVAHIHTSASGLALSNGQAKVTTLTAGRVVATDVGATFSYAARVLQLAEARANLFGGTWVQSGSITLSDPPKYQVTVRADGIACDALLTAITGEHPEYGCERFNADAAVQGEWRGSASLADNAGGSGHVRMDGGSIPSSSIIGALWHAMVPLIVAGREPRHIGDPTRVDHLSESFTLRGGRMYTTDLSLVTNDYTVTGDGSIGLDGTLDLDTQVALSPAGISKLLLMAALPIPGEVPSLPPISTRITGTVGSPFVRPEVEELPLNVVQGLFHGALGAGEAAGRGLRGLRDGIKDGLEEIW